jgi:hypothetical protein
MITLRYALAPLASTLLPAYARENGHLTKYVDKDGVFFFMLVFS